MFTYTITTLKWINKKKNNSVLWGLNFNSITTEKPVVFGFPIEVEFKLKCFFVEGGKQENLEKKNFLSKETNQQQSGPTYDTMSRNSFMRGAVA